MALSDSMTCIHPICWSHITASERLHLLALIRIDSLKKSSMMAFLAPTDDLGLVSLAAAQ